VLAISLPVFLYKLVVWKRAPADRADKMFAMPDLTDGFDILSPNRLPTSMAAKAKLLVVIALAIRLPVVLEKFSATELLSAHGATKVIFVPLMPERLYISTAYVLSATVTQHDTSNSSLPSLASEHTLIESILLISEFPAAPNNCFQKRRSIMIVKNRSD
jgi:hypothetical protein